MLDPKYLVTITYQPAYVIGHSLTFSSALGTYSMNVYSTQLYVATMPEALLTATGTSYTTALANLITAATVSTITKDDAPLTVVNK